MTKVNGRDELAFFRALVAGAPDPILVTKADVTIIYANESWERLTGYTLAEVCGKNPRLLQSGKTPASVYQNMWHDLRNGKPFVTELVIDKAKNGREFSLHATIFPVKQRGVVTHYVQMFQDITERKRLEELKEQFLSVVAHELKTPITSAKLHAQLLLHGAPEENRKPAEVINFQLDRLTGLVNDILDTTRIENGKLAINAQQTDVRDLVHETVARIQMALCRHTIRVKAVNNCQANCDPARIEQVLVNLLTNAAKHSPQGSTITVKIKQTDTVVTVSVRDTGEGIPKDKQPYIFDKFYQVKEGQGFGIGLYIAKQIIDRHNGKIRVRSKPGKGSTFSFSLPKQAS